MKRQILLSVLFILVMTASLTGSVTPSRAGSLHQADTDSIFLPVIMMQMPVPEAIIIDHRHTDISHIPDYWINEARKVTLHYAHTSHGSQVTSGLEWLDNPDSRYNVAIRVSETEGLPTDATALRIYDGNPPETYITPEDYWSTPDGISRTQAVVGTRHYRFSMWSWCGQQSSNSLTMVQDYLDTLDQFERSYPEMGFIFMTGHTDGTGPGGTLYRNNDLVRQYTQDHTKVLFDFADIETYDPDGVGPYYNNGEGTCQWCSQYCADHPGYCDNLPSSCAHSNSPAEARLFCKLKAQAFWWMMARMAGWDGISGP